MTSAIVAKGIRRTFGGSALTAALHDCDLTVGEGEFCAIVGTSGAGKTTLLNILGLLDRPTAGALEIAGVNAAELSEPERARLRAEHLGFVFQGYHLLPDRPALESVMLAGLYAGRSTRVRRREAAAALAEVGLSHRASANPRTLSGGEKQRVAIARALAMQPTLLLCDEPTGNLDSANSANVLELLKQVNATGRTIVLVTHDRAVAEQADRTVVMRDGKLHEA